MREPVKTRKLKIILAQGEQVTWWLKLRLKQDRTRCSSQIHFRETMQDATPKAQQQNIMMNVQFQAECCSLISLTN